MKRGDIAEAIRTSVVGQEAMGGHVEAFGLASQQYQDVRRVYQKRWNIDLDAMGNHRAALAGWLLKFGVAGAAENYIPGRTRNGYVWVRGTK